VEDHAQDVGGHDPVVAVDIHFVIPAEHVGRAGFGEEEKISQHHEALDVVGVAGGLELPDGVAHAGHAGVAVVNPARQRALGAEGVGVEVAGHFFPVDAVDKFAPADDLAHEAFHRVERGSAGEVSGDGGVAALQRAQQAAVEERCEHGVEEYGVFFADEVFIGAKEREAVADEVIEPIERLCARDWQAEGGRVAGMSGEEFLHVGDDLAGDGIGRAPGGLRRPGRAGADEVADAGAVVVVEVPCAALGLAVGSHQQAEFFAHGAVVVLHEEAFFVFREAGKFFSGAEEEVVGVDVDGCGDFFCEQRHGLAHGVFGGGDEVEGFGAEFFGVGGQRFCRGVFLVAKRVVVNLPAPGAEFFGAVAHGGVEECEAVGVVAQARTGGAGLDEDDAVGVGRGFGQKAVVVVEVVPEEPDGVFHSIKVGANGPLSAAVCGAKGNFFSDRKCERVRLFARSTVGVGGTGVRAERSRGRRYARARQAGWACVRRCGVALWSACF
jgi:hypothetical protein